MLITLLHSLQQSNLKFWVVKEYLGTSLDDALHKVLQRHIAEFIKEHSAPADVVELLIHQQKPQKSVKDIRKIKMEHVAKQQVSHKALYHALMKSILKDKDAIDKGVDNKLKKITPDDSDRDEDPPAGPDQRLKRRKMSKDVEPSKKTVFEAGDTQLPHNLREGMGKTDEPPIVKADPKEWFKKPERPPTPDPKWNTGKINNLKGDRYPFDLNKPLPLVELRNHLIVPADYFFNNDLAYLQGGSTDRTYTTSLTKTKAAKYDLKVIEDMVPTLWSPIKVVHNKHAALEQALQPQRRGNHTPGRNINYQKKLNISKPRTRNEDLSRKAPYTTLSNPQGVIYEDKLNRKRLTRSDELYKFSDVAGKKVDEELGKVHSLLLKELNDINSIDSLEAARKYKVCWAIEGDENIKFFHDQFTNRLLLEQQANLERNISNEEIKRSGGGRGVKEKDKVVATKDVVSPSVIDEPVVKEKQSSLVDTCIPNIKKTCLSSYPPLPTQGSTLVGNTLGMSSGNEIDVVVPVEYIRAISERFANTAYGFFLGKRVAYPCWSINPSQQQ
ncbi:hypothetical protein Tco_1146736 [Tanacetum coccineum]